MTELRIERLRADHAAEVLRFEVANREYFARLVPDRGDDYFADFAQRHAALLDYQQDGTDQFHVVLDGDRVVARVNLVRITADGSAELGYRVAQSAAGRGVATWAVREVVELARTRYGLRRLTAMTTWDNPASQAILRRTGFLQVGETEVGGRPGHRYELTL